jgi:hypothetical protein
MAWYEEDLVFKRTGAAISHVKIQSTNALACETPSAGNLKELLSAGDNQARMDENIEDRLSLWWIESIRFGMS